MFFRSKDDPKFGVKLVVKVTPKRGYPVPKMFTSFLELQELLKNYCDYNIGIFFLVNTNYFIAF